ncbi:MAG: DUF1127 domain-containing protein [Pseudomonadota bacterium]
MVYATAVNSKAFFGPVSKGTFNLPTRVWNSIVTYFEMKAAQRQLENLDDRLLNDIGIERADIATKVWGSYHA